MTTMSPSQGIAQKVGGAAMLPEGAISAPTGTMLDRVPPMNKNIVTLINKSVASGRLQHNNNSNNWKPEQEQDKQVISRNPHLGPFLGRCCTL